MKDEIKKLITEALDDMRRNKSWLAEQLGKDPAHISVWFARGFPRTEWTGETKYAGDIAKALENRVTAIELCPGASQYMDVVQEKAA